MGRLAMVLAAATVCCGLMVGGAMAQDAAARRFSAEVARGLAAKMPASKVEVVGELELSIKETNGRERRLNLRNLYGDYKNNPATLDAIVDSYYTALNKPASGGAAFDHARIVPVIKDRAWLADNERGLKARGVTARFLFDDFYTRLARRGMVIYPGTLGRVDCFRIGTIGQLHQADIRDLLVAVTEVLAEMKVAVPVAAPSPVPAHQVP